MPVQKDDRKSQWTLDQPDMKWVLSRSATITVNTDNAYGIYEGTNGSEIVVNGDIKASGDATGGVRFMSSTSTLEVGRDSFINAREAVIGVFAEGAGQEITNHGRVIGGLGGIDGAIWGEVANYGAIRGGTYGIYYEEGGSTIENHGHIQGGVRGIVLGSTGDNAISNDKHGLITGGASAIEVAGGEVSIHNKGTIRSDGYAIQAGDLAELELTNSGRIIGDIRLGAEANTIDTSRGMIDGTIFGGSENDTYIIAQSNLKIVEAVDGGNDQVSSSASYKLSANIEALYLRGKRDIDATGNEDNNDIWGNRGDNRLTGKDGDDRLGGYEGNDILTGGAGEDMFYFFKTGGRDVITDFENGSDLFTIFSVDNEDDFNDLRIRQNGHDTVIDFGRGNQIIVRDFDKQDLDYDDMFIVL